MGVATATKNAAGMTWNQPNQRILPFRWVRVFQKYFQGAYGFISIPPGPVRTLLVAVD